jgi:hypothetical protein
MAEVEHLALEEHSLKLIRSTEKKGIVQVVRGTKLDDHRRMRLFMRVPENRAIANRAGPSHQGITRPVGWGCFELPAEHWRSADTRHVGIHEKSGYI